ncbi:HPr family phosphocarrier protein [Thiorhodococcus minor]|uniref:HPr family phosphocarrier protein n=1 Tax=Thiorhodococcus minor TaxID=57489 RepID=A0A6M0K158_9GAMM|nr:HPr family phosphocarrier protein [Thiorhodococcus minor]NEV63061.1 HPr family phosphocarrier protein [Thiorhodococcus minor]
MIRKEFEICNKLGLHARAAAKLVQCAAHFESQIDIERRGQSVNCKSIMGVMMLAASQGTKVRVEARGDDEEEAILAIETLIRERFGEPE